MAHYCYYAGYKIIFMKQMWQRLFVGDEKTEGFHLRSTIFMVLAFLAFWGVSFYVLINSLA